MMTRTKTLIRSSNYWRRAVAAELERRRIASDRDLELFDFLLQAWPNLHLPGEISEPSKVYLRNFCADLSDMYYGSGGPELVISMPPGMLKSVTLLVVFPTWIWTKHPPTRFGFACYDLTKLTQGSRQQRTLMKSKWFLDRWGDRVNLKIRKDVEQSEGVEFFYNSASGFRLSTTPQKRLTGHHFDWFIVDDANNISDTVNDYKRVLDWFWRGVQTRKSDARSFKQIISGQRLRSYDLPGSALDYGWSSFIMPMRFDDKHPNKHPKDLRKNGELLDPLRFPDEQVSDLEKRLGPRAASAQLQQLPFEDAGEFFNEGHFKRFSVVPPGPGLVIDSWDFSGGGGAKRADVADDYSYDAGSKWFFHYGTRNLFLCSEIRQQMTFQGQLDSAKSLYNQTVPGHKSWQRPDKALIEGMALGPAVIQALGRLPGLHQIKPTMSKTARASQILPFVAQRGVFVHDSIYDAWVGEVARFPRRPDDRVDSMTQAIQYLLDTQGAYI